MNATRLKLQVQDDIVALLSSTAPSDDKANSAEYMSELQIQIHRVKVLFGQAQAKDKKA